MAAWDEHILKFANPNLLSHFIKVTVYERIVLV